MPFFASTSFETETKSDVDMARGKAKQDRFTRPRPNRLLCAGHSHIRRLESYLVEKERREAGSLNFKIMRQQLTSSFAGIGGARVKHLLPPSEAEEKRVRASKNQSAIALFEKHKSFAKTFQNAFEFNRPHSLALWIGDNDITSLDDGRLPQEIAEELAFHIMAQATAVKNKFGIQEVFIIQLLPRYLTTRSRSSASEISRYNAIAFLVNRVIYNEALSMGLNKHHLGFIFPAEDVDEKRYLEMRCYFDDEGVHLNNEGYAKASQALRHIAIRTAKSDGTRQRDDRH